MAQENLTLKVDAIKNIGDQPNFLIAFNTTKHDPQSPDVAADKLIAS